MIAQSRTERRNAYAVRENGYRFAFNGMEKDDEVKGIGNSLDFGARIYDSRLGRWLSVDPKAHLAQSWSSYNAMWCNPILNIDPNGQYAVSVHYRITYNTLIKLGYSKTVADNIAHHASVYADHPTSSVLKVDNILHGTNNSYRKGIDYSKTQFSQEEWRSNWHAMMSDAEATEGMTHEEAMQRGLSFGWGNIFAQQNEQDVGKLGQGLHAIQDAYAHNDASTDEHLGVNQSSAKMMWNDMYGSTSKAELITKSAGVLLQLFEGNTSSSRVLEKSGFKQTAQKAGKLIFELI